MTNINDDYGNGSTLIFHGMGLGERTYVVTDSQVTTKIFEIDGLPNFLRYGTALVRLRRAGAPLQFLQ